jgi:hypothetical protein
VIDGPEPSTAQQLGQLVGVRLIALVAVGRLATPIAHEDTIDDRHQEIVQPLRQGALLERDMDRARMPRNHSTIAAASVGKNRSCDHLSRLLSHHRHRGCLVHIEPDILG